MWDKIGQHMNDSQNWIAELKKNDVDRIHTGAK